MRRRQPAQALVEAMLFLVLLASAALIVLGLGLLARDDGAVAAVAADAAHAGAVVSRAEDVEPAARARATQVAEGYGLASSRLDLAVDPSQFGRDGEVRVVATYTESLGEIGLPWGDVLLHHEAVEQVGPYRTFR